jgi:hypothetical protein
MRAWSEALIEAFLKADGTMPAPSATIRKPKVKQKSGVEAEVVAAAFTLGGAGRELRQ